MFKCFVFDIVSFWGSEIHITFPAKFVELDVINFLHVNKWDLKMQTVFSGLNLSCWKSLIFMHRKF